MKKITIGKGQVLHRKGEEVRTLEIVLAGALTLTDGNNVEVLLESGALAGAIYLPGDVYAFDYVAAENSTLAETDYFSEEDIVTAVSGAPAIAPIMASSSMSFTRSMLDALTAAEKEAADFCKDLKYNYNNYKFMCVKLERDPQSFPYIDSLEAPEPSGADAGWEAGLCRAFCAKKEELKKSFYALDVSFCAGTVMQAAAIGRGIRRALEAATGFISVARKSAADFMAAFYDVKSRVDTQTRSSSDDVPVISNALDIILSFSGVKNETAEAFRKDIKRFIEVDDKRSQNNDIRALRMRIATAFYEIYEAAFFRSMEATHLPIEVRMFFLFGFVDEVLAGAANTVGLYNIAVGWESNPDGMVLPMYEWLVKIYRGEALPSKNEFDNDWPGYLRESLRNGTLTQQRVNELQEDRTEMVRFEIQNMFKSANRITNGQITSFVPVFCAQHVIRALDKSLVSPARAKKAFDKVLDIDFSCFYRPAVIEYPALKIQRFVYNLEVRPYLILMPNFGGRGIMWQEIEGARRTTPAHILISIFHSEDIDETVVKMCAQFRWEMCRRIQGVRYTDISERSLTSEYVNYLQFYKKNSLLSNDVKEHVKLALQKARNDYKGVFISEYQKYIQNEAFGLPRLNKVARDILFRYCTLSKKFRTSLGTNPQFKPLFERWGVRQGAKVHTIDLIIQKLSRMLPEGEVPKEILAEAEFMRR